MITTKVFKVLSDVETVCHCGHHIHQGEEYYIIRTSVPKWIALCLDCVHLLGQPQSVNMKELKRLWSWEKDGVVKEGKVKRLVTVKKRDEANEKDLEVAEWV